jgi:UPF0176 protein
MSRILNIAAYKFAALDKLEDRREQLRLRCDELELKGTILLSAEGINLFVAGTQDSIHSLIGEIRAEDSLRDLEVKESRSDRQPFTRMLVKIKQEIIAFGIDGIDPVNRPSPKLPATTLKEWLDAGKEVTLLDVRNDYEVDVGTFEGAVPIGLDHFRKFPEAVARLPEEMKEKPLVMFCTGGIRCEKAGPFMEQHGFKEVYQLSGGILKYFEDCGGEHYDGDCFVFDQRVALDPNLDESPVVQCYACLTPLSLEEQGKAEYVAGVSCSHCFERPAQKLARLLDRRHQQIRELTRPLPGCAPYNNRRPINVSQRFDHQSLGQVLQVVFPHITKDQWEERIAAGLLLDAYGKPATLDRAVRGGQQYFHITPATIEPEVNPNIEILYEDQDIVVVNKPAPLPMHPCGRFNRNSLSYILNEIYQPMRLLPAHRLDANTSGVVVFSRSKNIASKLQPQFEKRQVGKIYLVKAVGLIKDDKFRSEAGISENPGPAGLRTIDENGLEAKTDFEVISRCEESQTTLLRATLHTGRTNQIRLHLWDLGHPIVGDGSYLADRKIAETQTKEIGVAALCLQANSLTFRHPRDDQEVTFQAQKPQWLDDTTK